MDRISAITLQTNEDSLASAVIQPALDIAYFGCNGSPTYVVKTGLSPLARVGALQTAAGYDDLNGAAIDIANGFAYFCAWSGGQIRKIQLSDFTLAASLGVGSPFAAVIDTTNGFLYVGRDTTPGRVMKIQLSDFTAIASLAFTTQQKQVRTGAIDVSAGFAYFGCYTIPGRIVKVRLSDFTVNNSLILSTGGNITTSVIDTDAGYAYFGTDQGDIFKIQLSDFTENSTFTPTGNALLCSVIHPAAGYAYFGDNGYPATVYEIRLSDFTLNDSLTLNAGENNLEAAVIDTTDNITYWGCYTTPGTIVKVGVAGAVTATQHLPIMKIG